MKATISKIEHVKDSDGNFVYEGLDAFRAKIRKQAERYNKKITKSHSEGKMLSYSVLDIDQYIESMVNIYGNQFRATKSIAL